MRALQAIIAAVLLACTLSLGAQEVADQPENRPAEDVVREETKEEVEKPPAETERREVPEKKAEKREAPARRKAAPEKKAAGEGEDRLMEAEDSRVTLGRIPGLKLPERQASRIPSVESGLKEDASLRGEEIPDENAAEEKKGEGLFGFSKTVTDILARIALVGLILLIIILYRLRSRTRRKVFSPSRSSRKYKP
jgi:hypothetical protein